MRIFKFGGASVKDADGVRNVANILQQFNNEKIVVVISAMGKITNQLEILVKQSFEKNKEYINTLNTIKDFHRNIILDLNPNNTFQFFYEVDNLFLELECIVENPSADADYDNWYDQIVSFGELISTKIVSTYLFSLQVKNQWIDARNFILTDDRYRDARVRWEITEANIAQRLKPIVEKSLVITQGFIGRSNYNDTVTLGREGSDYTAAILAYCLEAKNVTIWKDVAGVMNADPKKFADATLISELNYNDAIELAYYGASVIHPKTIQPLKSKNIPLFVKSFININDAGTVVNNTASSLNIACYIHKNNQTMVQIKSSDFTFIVEDHLREIFNVLAQYKVRCNIMQNSAISFSFAADINEEKLQYLINELQKKGFEISTSINNELLTVYNANTSMQNSFLNNKKIIMEQQQSNTIHYLLQ